MLVFGVRHQRVTKMILPIMFLLSVAILYYSLSPAAIRRSRSILRRDDLEEDSDDTRLYVNDHREHEAHGVLFQQDTTKVKRDGKFAFVTLMCDDSWLPQLRVLVYSWKRMKSHFPLVVLASPLAQNVDDLIALGATIKRVDLLEVPFKRKNGRKLAFEKQCRYSKLHAWSLTDFERLVYLDPMLMIVQNIDELFQYNHQFSGVKVVGDEFNTGLFVMKPDAVVYKKMLAEYKLSPPEHRGEQGFLNWFFREADTKVISARYNTVIRQKDYAVWPLLKRSAKVFHFTQSTTPWNFFHNSHANFESNYERSIFGYWNLIHHQAMQLLGVGTPLYIHSDLVDDFAVNGTWANAKRVTDVCTSITSMYNPKRFTVHNKFSVIIGTWDRVALLRKIILHYQKSRSVHKIYVTWHNPGNKPPEEFLRLVRRKPPVEILGQKYDSLNNRFNPIANLETKAVLVADDDIRVDIGDMEYGFEVWKTRPQSLVGVFPRYHQYHPTNNTFTYELRSPDRPRSYSIMLTKFMFMSSEYLYDYTCTLPTKVHRYIDDHLNCEDVAMNLLVSGMTGAKPVSVLMAVDDFGTTSGISIKQGHLSNRSTCMTDLIRLFGRDTLKYNRELFTPFRKRRT